MFGGLRHKARLQGLLPSPLADASRCILMPNAGHRWASWASICYDLLAQARNLLDGG